MSSSRTLARRKSALERRQKDIQKWSEKSECNAKFELAKKEVEILKERVK